MRYVLFTFLVSGILLVSSCKKDEEVGTVTLNFKAVYDGQPLYTFDTKPFSDGQELQFTHLSMLVSELTLTRQGGTELLDEIELVNLSFEDLATAEAGYTVRINDVPAATYSAISFGIGVPADLNAMSPADFSSNNPLSNTGYYWLPWSSYIFQKVEGRLDTLGNGALDLGFALHTGSDPLYQVLTSSIPMTVEDGMDLNLDIVLDYKLLLDGIDIKANPQNHNPQDITTIQAMVDNLGAAFTLIQ